MQFRAFAFFELDKLKNFSQFALFMFLTTRKIERKHGRKIVTYTNDRLYMDIVGVDGP